MEDARAAVIYLRFADLKARGIVGNWQTLQRWIREQGFPAGRMLGPNTRAWSEEEVQAWLDARPVGGRNGSDAHG
ncbi:MAG TPA: AlpA family phage regulatory protein [Methyloceanibacter sp.]|nr:AlpA family phage regulatory protein [Methyloceanibacter sp.]